jgi:hypothetical protein
MLPLLLCPYLPYEVTGVVSCMFIAGLENSVSVIGRTALGG